ncbi:MAG: DNA alkylation repair protein [Myxococcales bacterium]|nr:DNA alkylation repair protein [Myxococcales bacterium]
MRRRPALCDAGAIVRSAEIVMTLAEALAALEAAGNPNIATVYQRHGVAGPAYGVRLGDVDRIRRQIGTDAALASALWGTGNHDARVLACRVADPLALSAEQLAEWVAAVDNYVLADALAGLAAKSPHRARLGEIWRADPREYVGRLGWRMIAQRVMAEPEVPAALLEAWLGEIQVGLAGALNRTKEAMHDALIAIGGTRPDVRERALAVARAVSPVAIDHGETGCKTPDAVAYIARMAERQSSGPGQRKTGSTRHRR